MSFRFRDLSVALKLNIFQGAVLLAVIAIATMLTANHLRQQLENQSLQELRQTNRLVVSMLEAYDSSLRSDIKRSAHLFAATFDQPFVLNSEGNAPRLSQRGLLVADQQAVVDSFTAASGANATLLVRRGDDFVRAVTSVKDGNGVRASGTPLGGEHPALSALLAGNEWTGKVFMLERDYMTHYVPAKDASGKVVGAFFVGIDLTEGIKALRQSVLSIKLGETGYVYALDAGQKKGQLTLHPSKEGANLLAAKDSNGFEFVREMVEKKTGTLRYDWAAPGETRPREKIAVFDHYPAWNWVVASGSYMDEFSQGAGTAVADILIMALAIILGALISGFVATRIWVTQPLQAVISAANRIAEGDLTARARSNSRDEVGQLTDSIGRMAENLERTVSDVRGASAAMLSQSLALVASAEQVRRSSEAGSDAASSMAASVEEMSVSIDQVAEHARAAQNTSADSGKTAQQGGAVIQQAVNAMDEIADTVRDASLSVSALGASSKEISTVVQVIREIADQTNLLALNAAIEAARAGEQGRGFAVVADEVRKLAERTSTSTLSIASMIADIQSGAVAAVDRMGQGVQQVTQGGVLAEEAGQAIGRIDATTRDVINAVGGISDAISEQSIASQTIAHGVERIAQMAESNYSASVATARSAGELREMAIHLEKTLARFRTT